MVPDTLKIKCPYCSCILIVKHMPNIETKTIPCPTCKKTSRFTEYKLIPPPSTNDDSTQIEDITKLETFGKGIGRLRQPGTGKEYSLKLGLNIIGRKAQTSNATLQIDTNDRTMSRSHLSIEVCKLTTGGYIHYLSNAQNKNATYVNGQEVKNKDRIVLNGGEIIKMGDTIMKYVCSHHEDSDTTY